MRGSSCVAGNRFNGIDGGGSSNHSRAAFLLSIFTGRGSVQSRAGTQCRTQNFHPCHGPPSPGPSGARPRGLPQTSTASARIGAILEHAWVPFARALYYARPVQVVSAGRVLVRKTRAGQARGLGRVGLTSNPVDGLSFMVFRDRAAEPEVDLAD